MDFLKVLEIISLITTIIGLYLLGEKNALAFHIYNISLICQIYIFYKEKKWFLISQMGVLIAFNLFNYYKWTGGLI
jgi:hypothetical protein